MDKQPTLTLPVSDDYTFTQWITSTTDLQVAAYGRDPADVIGDDIKEFFTWNAFAAIVELGELANEVSWKPWATGTYVNRTAAIEEIVDCMHFLSNILRFLHCTGTDLTSAYKAKQRKNLQRQIDGYDGVQGKCPGCHRDVTDPSSTVTTIEHGVAQRFCAGCGRQL